MDENLDPDIPMTGGDPSQLADPPPDNRTPPEEPIVLEFPHNDRDSLGGKSGHSGNFCLGQTAPSPK